MKLTAFLIASSLCACNPPEATSAKGKHPEKDDPISHVGDAGKVFTIKHDGHFFVIFQKSDTNGGVSILHHPSCDCLKTSEKP